MGFCFEEKESNERVFFDSHKREDIELNLRFVITKNKNTIMCVKKITDFCSFKKKLLLNYEYNKKSFLNIIYTRKKEKKISQKM